MDMATKRHTKVPLTRACSRTKPLAGLAVWPLMPCVTDIYSVSAKNLPFQNCMYLQRIGTFEILKKV